MKILLATSFFPPTHTAGTEKRTFGYAKTLLEHGHQVQVLCAGDWDEGKRYWNGHTDEIYQQIPVRRVHLNWKLAPDPNHYLYCNPVIQKYLYQWLKQWRPDLVHITSCLTLSASVIQAVKDHHLPLLLTLTDFWFICPRLNLQKGNGSLCDGRTSAWDCLKCKLWGTNPYRIVSSVFPEVVSENLLTLVSRSSHLNRLSGLRGLALNMEERKAYLAGMLQSVDCITAPSAALAEVVHLNYPSKEIKVVTSGHDLSWMKSLPPKKPSDVLRIAYLGQIIAIKGVHILLSAFCLAGIDEKAVLSIYGDQNKDHDYFRGLEEIAEKHRINLKFIGSYTHGKLGEIMSDVDMIVVPSLWHENNPRVIQEAYAAHTPVIASDVAGISEFVQHDVNGLLFERGNPVDLAKQLNRLINEQGLLEKLKVGIPKVKSMDEEVDELEDIYLQLAHNGKIIKGGQNKSWKRF